MLRGLAYSASVPELQRLCKPGVSSVVMSPLKSGFPPASTIPYVASTPMLTAYIQRLVFGYETGTGPEGAPGREFWIVSDTLRAFLGCM